MTEKQLRSCFNYWVKQLRLQDWHITFYISSQEEFETLADSNTSIALNFYDYQQKASKIYLLCEKDYKLSGERVIDYDPESSIVHELLHLHYAAFFEKCADTKLDELEISINMIADTLVRTKRGQST